MFDFASDLLRIRKTGIGLLLLLIGSLFSLPVASAQSGAGSIQGTVTDTTGAVIPGVSVRVLNPATNVATETVANQVGFFQVPGLFAGTYSITISAPGMKSYQATLQLLADQHAVLNPVLAAGSVSEKIEVVATAQMVTMDSGTISSTLDNARINQLPMNGRLLLGLAANTTPGLEGGTRANGLMDQALEYVADGVPMVNRNFGGASNSTQAQLPDPDSVQEVRMETNNSSAAFATPATGIITTKSGTNRLHGTMFETARNNYFGIAKSRSNAANFAAPHYVRNEFGASAGGPIVLPKLYDGHDHSFWFFAFEKYSLRSNQTEIVKVPTMAMRQGDFSGLVDSSGVQHPIYDPNTTASSSSCNGGAANAYCRTPFSGNKIPIERLAPATKMLYAITPKPNLDYNPLVQGNFIAPNIDNRSIPTITFRLDHNRDENNRAYLRYTHLLQQVSQLRNYPSNSAASVAAGDFPEGATGYSRWVIANFAAAAGYTHVFSPTFYSETVISQQWFNQYAVAGGNPDLNYEKMLGLPNDFGQLGFPTIGSSLLMPYGGSQFNYRVAQILSNVDENLTKIHGRHQFQFGARYRHERFGSLPDRQADTVSFGAYATALVDPKSSSYAATTSSGYADADFFLGAAYGYSETKQPPYARYRDMEFDAYFQDNYHLTKNMTVNIGLRYEAHPAAYTADGLTVSFDLKNKAYVMQNAPSWYVQKGYTTQAILTNLSNLGVRFETPQAAGYPAKMMRDYNLTFGPRVGFAYQLFGGRYGTVLRGAYGRYIYPVPVRNSVKQAVVNLPYVAGYGRSYTSAAQSPDGLANYLMRKPQTIIMGQNSTGVVDTSSVTAITPGISPYAINPVFPPTYVTQTNLTIEQQLKGNTALRITWLWAHGTNLDQQTYINYHPSTYVWEMQNGIAPPQGTVIGSSTYSATATGPYDQTTYGQINWDEKIGWSNNNALQATFQRLFHHGSAYQIMWVWSSPFRAGGNFNRDNLIYPYTAFFGTGGYGSNVKATMSSPYGTVTAPVLPTPPPPGSSANYSYHALNAFENYKRDTATPFHHIRFNGIFNLPLGRGQKYFGNVNRLMDELIGGYQIAGFGQIISQAFQPSAANWGPTQPIQVYKKARPVTDCRSGRCVKAYQWFNGYLAPSVINASNGVQNLPTDTLQRAYQTPIVTDNVKTDPAYKYYNTNTVFVTTADSSITTPLNADPQAFSPGPSGASPWAKTILRGPYNYNVDLSLFKIFPITSGTNLRLNVDAFNVLNLQGYNNPGGTDGIMQVVPQSASSYWTPRQLQFTLRFSF